MSEGRRTISRREFLRGAALTATALVAGACAQPTPERVEVEVTRIVEVAGTPQVQQVVVTATPVPVKKRKCLMCSVLSPEGRR
jgi:anaerobic selenocysteine-containing dehydrogenase